MSTFLDSRGEPVKDVHVSLPEAKAKLDSRDVVACFSVFLGGAPAKTSLQSSELSDLQTLLREIFESEKFKAAILQPLLLREALPHIEVEKTPPLALIAWAQKHLPISLATRRALGAIRTWAQLLEVLLSDAHLVRLAPDLAEAGIDTVLRQRLENEPWSKVDRSVIGVIDAASAFEIRGWAVDMCDRSTPVTLEFYADGLFIGAVKCNEPRADVQDTVGEEGRFGFTFEISTGHRAHFARGRTLTAIDSISRAHVGSSVVVSSDAAQNWDAISATRNEIAQLRQMLERIEARLPEIGHMASIPIEAYDEYWERFYRPSPEILAQQKIRSEQLTYKPLISLILPTWNSKTQLLEKAIASVQAQTYDRWELVITDDASESDELRTFQQRWQIAEPRIRWVEAGKRSGIAINTNRGIEASTGEYVAFLDHDDELAPDALYHIVLSLQKKRYGLLYSDEDRIEENEFGRCVHHTPFFKPSFDPDLLLALNYICHLVVVRRDVVTTAGGLRAGVEGAQDHDFLLRVAEHLSPSEILHLPRVLYHWRVTPGSVSRTSASGEEIQQNIVTAVADHLRRVNAAANVQVHSDPVGTARQFATRVRWALPSPAPKISIVVATRDRSDLLRPCLNSVIDSLALYPGQAEILLVDNDSIEPTTLSYFSSLSALPQIRMTSFRGQFNWSAINNAAAAAAQGEVLIFLNNDTVVLTKEWCVELVSNALRKDVGAVGARLLYPDGTIQHAGVLLGVEGVAGHESVGDTAATAGYFGRNQMLRSAAAVTGACLATRRMLFQQLGGFDDLNLKVAFNDVDYCMKVRKAGYRIVYDPFAVLYHLESKSRGREISEAQQTRHRAEAVFFRQRWGDKEIEDPYYNLHFERYARPFDRLRPPPSKLA
jgi:O-antigen biosynthesis protein